MTENVTDLAEARRLRRRGQGPTEMPKTLFILENWTEIQIEYVGAPTLEHMPLPPLDGDVIGVYELVGVKRVRVKMDLEEEDGPCGS